MAVFVHITGHVGSGKGVKGENGASNDTIVAHGKPVRKRQETQFTP